MKGLTICQPYAHLICVTRTKRVENRTWPTRHRGPLLIHAGKSRDWLNLMPGEDRDFEYGIPLADMAFGALIGIADLVDCARIEDICAGDYDHTHPWLRSHEHTSGPWCWVLDHIRAFESPVPWRGANVLFNAPENDPAIAHQLDLLGREPVACRPEPETVHAAQGH